MVFFIMRANTECCGPSPKQAPRDPQQRLLRLELLVVVHAEERVPEREDVLRLDAQLA